MYDREEWKRLLRTARNHRILYMPMDWLIDFLLQFFVLLNYGQMWNITVKFVLRLIRDHAAKAYG